MILVGVGVPDLRLPISGLLYPRTWRIAYFVLRNQDEAQLREEPPFATPVTIDLPASVFPIADVQHRHRPLSLITHHSSEHPVVFGYSVTKTGRAAAHRRQSSRPAVTQYANTVVSGHNSNNCNCLGFGAVAAVPRFSKNSGESSSFSKRDRLRICSRSPMLRSMCNSLRTIATST